MKSSTWKWITVLAAAGALVGIVICSNRFLTLQRLLQRALDGIPALGVWGQVSFVLIYIAATVLVIPGSALGLSVVRISLGRWTTREEPDYVRRLPRPRGLPGKG